MIFGAINAILEALGLAGDSEDEQQRDSAPDHLIRVFDRVMLAAAAIGALVLFLDD